MSVTAEINGLGYYFAMRSVNMRCIGLWICLCLQNAVLLLFPVELKYGCTLHTVIGPSLPVPIASQT